MSFRAVDAVLQADIRPAAVKLVAVVFANRLNESTGLLNPSMATVAREAGLSKCQARRCARILIDDMGVLEVIGNAKGGAPTATPHYRLNLDRLPSLAPRAHASPSVEARASADAPDPSRPCTEPLAPVHQTPSAGASQTGREPEGTRNNRKGVRVKRARTPLPDGFSISPRVEAWAKEKGHTRLLEHLEAFKLKCQAKGYVYADWDASFMSAIANDWAGLGAVDAEPEWRREQRERNEAFLGAAAAKRRTHRGFVDVDYAEGVADDGRIA